VLVALLLLGAPSAFAQAPAPAPPPAPPPAPAGAQDQAPADQPPAFEEQVVVSASRSEQQLVDAPASVSVVNAETIQNSPVANMGDLLRAVPGVNVSQVSARDVNITTRGATSTLSTSQLALVDGRTIYLDFFGMVMWDLVPTNADEIKQIEVIRGPASAVWGANAMSGVVNVITRSPRELAARGGSSLTIGAGAFDRSAQGVDRDAGSLFYVNGTHAQVLDDRWSFKLSAGYLTQDALPRPVGAINNAFHTPYPDYVNSGTTQPKFDARVDYDLQNQGRLTFAGGVAGTEGIIHSGIGPFDIARGSRLSYLTTRYEQGGRHIAFFTNLLDGDAANLLSRGTNGLPLPLTFDTKTFDIDATDVHAIGSHHVLSYGGNFRRNTFDISIAPGGDARNEGGAYLQDEIFLGTHFRWVVGGRVDKFSSIKDAVFSPRTTFLIKPSPNQTFRVSVNRAFRAPSYVNNNIDTTILNQVNLSAISPLLANFVFPVHAQGNPDLVQETMTAYELGYTGVLRNRSTVTAAVYWNNTDNGIYFTQVAKYTPANPPPTLPPFIPPAVLNFIPEPGLPSLFTYRNFGTVKDKGLELGIDTAVNRSLNVFVNYSYQADPIAEGFDAAEINFPANNRFNAGFNASYGRYLGNLTVSYTDQAYWQDVLDRRFAGVTDAFTLVNIGAGVKWWNDKLTTSIKVTNLANHEVMQHIFGDIMRRQVVGEVRASF
jgi:iron complex outermembrane receptor protein